MDGGHGRPFVFDRSEIRRHYTRGSGNGGQHRNKTETVVVLTHMPTGIIVKCEDERSRHRNEEKAWEEMERRLREIHEKGSHEKVNDKRSSQIGCGERADKRRTYRQQDDTVSDHVTGKRARLKDVMRGKIELLH